MACSCSLRLLAGYGRDTEILMHIDTGQMVEVLACRGGSERSSSRCSLCGYVHELEPEQWGHLGVAVEERCSSVACEASGRAA